ncbi:MAG: hypothetical protein QOF57_2549, partial [Frankiaceae bacterium]|nr:hypothetical protein [Frankiaceae bacterium]
DDNDHLGALAELAAQVSEESSNDTVEDETVTVRYEPEAFATETDGTVEEMAPHVGAEIVDVVEPELTDAEVAEPPAHADDVPAGESAHADQHVETPVEVLVVSDAAISQLLADVQPGIGTDAAPEPITVEPVAVEAPAVEPVAVEAPGVEPIAVEPVAVEAPAVEPVAVEPVAIAPIAVEAPAAPEAPAASEAPAAPEAPPAPASHGEDAIPTRPHIDTESIPPLTEEELAAVSDLPMVPVARGISPEAGGRREGARSLGFFAR